MIELDEARHIYTVDGVQTLSVTDVLRPLSDFSHVDPALLAWHRMRGRHVHKAIELWNAGDLDEEDLDPQIAPFLAGWKQFIADTGFTVTHGELRVFHPVLRYAGTLDIRGIMRRVSWIIDLKLGVPMKSWGPQTAGYREAIPAGDRPRRRACLRLLPNAYTLHPHRDARDFARFLTCLNYRRMQDE